MTASHALAVAGRRGGRRGARADAARRRRWPRSPRRCAARSCSRAAPRTARIAPVFNGRYAGVRPAAVAQPLDARDLAAALRVARARELARAHPRGRPQLHRRLDGRGRRGAGPAAAARHQAARRRQRAGGRRPPPDRADRRARAARPRGRARLVPDGRRRRVHAGRRLRLRRAPLRPGLRHAGRRARRRPAHAQAGRWPTPTCCTACAAPARAWRP